MSHWRFAFSLLIVGYSGLALPNLAAAQQLDVQDVDAIRQYLDQQLSGSLEPNVSVPGISISARITDLIIDVDPSECRLKIEPQFKITAKGKVPRFPPPGERDVTADATVRLPAIEADSRGITGNTGGVSVKISNPLPIGGDISARLPSIRVALPAPPFLQDILDKVCGNEGEREREREREREKEEEGTGGKPRGDCCCCCCCWDPCHHHGCWPHHGCHHGCYAGSIVPHRLPAGVARKSDTQRSVLMVMNRIDDSGRVQREDVYVSHAFAAQWGYFPDARQTPHLASATAEHRTVGYAPEESPDTPTLAKPAEPAGDWVEMVKHWTDADGVEHSKTVRVSREFAAAWGYRPEPSN